MTIASRDLAAVAADIAALTRSLAADPRLQALDAELELHAAFAALAGIADRAGPTPVSKAPLDPLRAIEGLIASLESLRREGLLDPPILAALAHSRLAARHLR